MSADFVSRGRSLLAQGQAQEAIRVCRLGLLAAPDEGAGRVVLAQALLALTRSDEVLAEARTLLATNPHHAQALCLKAEALLQKGDPEQAQMALNNVRASRDPEVVRLLSAIDEARASERKHARPQTLDLDSELDALTVETSATRVQDPLDQDTGSAIEIGTADLEPLSEEFDELEPSESYDEATEIQSGFIETPAERRGPALDELFPDEDSGIASLESLAHSSVEVEALPTSEIEGVVVEESLAVPGRGDPSADMRLIRDALGISTDKGKAPPELQPEIPEVSTEAAPMAPMASVVPVVPVASVPPAPRSKAPKVMLMAFALVVAVGGVAGGFKIRQVRLSRQVGRVVAQADKLSTLDDFAGHTAARDLYQRLDSTLGDAHSAKLLAHQEALLAAEFGEPVERAGQQVGTANSAHARAYLDLATADLKALAKETAQLLTHNEQDWEGHYLRGRYFLVIAEYKEAQASFDKALELKESKRVWIGKGRALAAQGRHSAAIEAFGKAVGVEGANAMALAFQSISLAATGKLPQNVRDPDETLSNIVERQTASRLGTAWAALALAQVKISRGDIPAAQKSLSAAAARRGARDIRLGLALAAAFSRVGEDAKADKELTATLEAMGEAPHGQLLRARIALDAGDARAAERALKKVEGDTANSIQSSLLAGRIELALGNVEAAAKVLDAVLEKEPVHPEALASRARIDLARGETESALKRLGAVDSKTTHVAVAATYAAALRVMGRLSEAEAILEPFVKDNPDAVALLESARVLRLQGKFGDAEGLLERAMENSNRMDLRLEAASLALARGKPKNARGLVNQAVSSPAATDVTRAEAARVLTEIGDADAALDLLSKTGDEPTTVWLVSRERGRALLRRLQYFDATTALDRAVSLRKTDAETRLLLLEAHLQTGNTKAAKAALRDLKETFDVGVTQLLGSGLVAMLRERGSDAVSAFSQARGLLREINAAPADFAYVAYWLGRAYEMQNNVPDAKKWLLEAVELNPGHASAQFYLGQVAFFEERFAAATRRYKKAVALDPGAHPMAWYFLGIEYERQKRTAQAIKAFEEFLRRWPEDSGDEVVEARTRLGQLK